MRATLLWLAVALVALTARVSRADDAVLKEAIGLAGPAMWLDSGAPGMVLVVVRGPDAVIEGYGETEKGNNRQPDAKSLFRLGSITKVFATEVLADMAADGKLRLTDPLQRYAGNVQVPRFGGRPITLLDLATHSAGLPREMGFAPAGTPAVHLAHAPGPLGLAARLQARLGARHRGGLFQYRLRPADGRDGDGGW